MATSYISPEVTLVCLWLLQLPSFSLWFYHPSLHCETTQFSLICFGILYKWSEKWIFFCVWLLLLSSVKFTHVIVHIHFDWMSMPQTHPCFCGCAFGLFPVWSASHCCGHSCTYSSVHMYTSFVWYTAGSEHSGSHYMDIFIFLLPIIFQSASTNVICKFPVLHILANASYHLTLVFVSVVAVQT